MANTGMMSSDWTAVLSRVEEALARAIGQIEAREQALGAAELPAPRGPEFAALDSKAAALADAPGRITARIEPIDAELRQGEEALRRWLADAEAVRQRLAAWVGRAVG